MRYALINSENQVRNVIELDEDSVWPIPEGFILVASETLNPGDIYQGEE